MSCVTRIQILRGTTSERLNFTPLKGELIFDTDLNQVFVGDGNTVGGLPLTAETSLTLNVRNETGQSIPKGTFVYINGATGNKPTIDIADNNLDVTADNTLGITQGEILNNELGTVLIEGIITGLDTSSFNEGDLLYLGSNGSFVNNKPLTPLHEIFVGYILNSNNSNGEIFIKIQNFGELDDLHDVLISNISNRDILIYNDTDQYWENGTLNKSDVGLGNVDNTSDPDKPVSNVQQAALDLKYDVSNPAGYQTAADVTTAIDAVIDSAPGALDTLNELAAALGDDANFASTVASQQATQDAAIALNTAKVSADGSVTDHNDVTSAGSGEIITTAERTLLNSQSGVNTGDETTSSIQTKRPLKTIEGQSLEGTGDIDISSNDVGLGNVNNTSDLNKPISTATQNALDLKYDASNPANYIDSAGAPVQPSDISDFETTTQLNSRDVANRDRSNHTGTQLANTISNFATAVQANETDTTLTIVGNTLRYIGEDGTNQDIDLSMYIDDTNLARLVSGTVDSSGIATFTREDDTTFTVDFSSLLDNQTANEVPVTPSGNLASTNTQDALEELQSDLDIINSQSYVNSVNGEFGEVTNVAKTNQSNTFITNQRIEGLQEDLLTIRTTDNLINAGITFKRSGSFSGAKIVYNPSSDSLELGSSSGVISPLTIQPSLSLKGNGDNSFEGNKGINFADPDDPQDAATKNYVDSRSINSLNDVDTNTVSPNTGDILIWDGSNWIPTQLNTLGSSANPITSLQQASILGLNGRQFVNFGGGNFQASFDNGAMLILQYHHLANTNPNLNIIGVNSDLPIFDNSALGADFSGDLTRFGHSGNAAFNSIPDSDPNLTLRFQGSTTGHSRILDFNTGSGFGISYLRSGTGNFTGIQNNFTPNSGHTGNIPASVNGGFGDSGDQALTNFPFFQGATSHWGIKGLGNRWEVDDFVQDTQSTIHRVWVKYE